MLAIARMPGESERDKSKRLRDEKQALRDAAKAAATEKTRLEKLMAEVPNAADRCKLALSIPSDAYPELDTAPVGTIIAYFGVSRDMYFTGKKGMEAAIEVKVSAERLARSKSTRLNSSHRCLSRMPSSA